ncbi:hypothetical protein EYW47_25895 [Paraburkholderia silviterrae]|uniref:Uncharacterized protein n=1 Tax=Paraburkholderia silviterrae TaxID=2528715 RepID=A0A4R5M5B3_9BURK|nr:hypothetical protein EYW47_25895 [Paraburkholderia silviterrae]
MDILNIAREAGFAVLLQGRIGRQEYSSVSGTEEALRCFADAIRTATQREQTRRAAFWAAARPKCHSRFMHR